MKIHLILVLLNFVLPLEMGLAQPSVAQAKVREQVQTSSQSSNAYNQAVQERVFLTSLARYVYLFEQMNVGLLKRRMECFKNNVLPEHCRADELSIRSYTEVNHPMIRQLLITYNVLDLSYAKMMAGLLSRVEWQLHEPLLRPHMYYPIEGWDIEIPYENSFKSDVPEYDYTENDFRKAIEKMDMMVTDLANENQNTEYDHSINGLTQKICHENLNVDKSNAPMIAVPRPVISAKIKPELCEYFRLVYDQERKAHYFAYQFKNGVPFSQLSKQDYYDFLFLYHHVNAKIDELKEITHGYIVQLIQENPYVALLKNEHPSNQELYNAFAKVQNLAQEALERTFEKKQMMEAGKLSRNEELEFMGYGPIAQHLLDFPSDEMKESLTSQISTGIDFYSIAENLHSEYEEMISARTLKEIGVMVATTALCWANPLKKGYAPIKVFSKTARQLDKLAKFKVKGKRRALFTRGYHSLVKSLLCISVLPFAVNGYFAAHDYFTYKTIYAELFASSSTGVNQPLDLDGDGHITDAEKKDYEALGMQTRLLREVVDLEPIQAEAFWTAMFAPIGVWGTAKFLGAGVLQILNQSSRLSTASIRYLEKVFPRLSQKITPALQTPTTRFMRYEDIQ